MRWAVCEGPNGCGALLVGLPIRQLPGGAPEACVPGLQGASFLEEVALQLKLDDATLGDLNLLAILFNRHAPALAHTRDGRETVGWLAGAGAGAGQQGRVAAPTGAVAIKPHPLGIGAHPPGATSPTNEVGCWACSRGVREWRQLGMC